jgi:hypothetical protein
VSAGRRLAEADHAQPSSACFEVLGTRVRVSCTSTGLRAKLYHVLTPFSVPTEQPCREHHYFSVQSSERGFYSLYRDDRPVARSARQDSILNRLLSELNSDAIEGFAGFATHAGVVAHGRRAIAFVGGSGSGKSTIVAACIAGGLEYISDEALCVEFGSLSVAPYPKPLRLSSSSRRALELVPKAQFDGEVTVAASDLGARLASPPLELAHVVRLVRGPVPARLNEVVPACGAAWLLRFSFNHYKEPLRTFDLVAGLGRQTQAWYLEYEEARAAASLVAGRLAS